MAARAGPTPALLETMGGRIAEGASLAQLCTGPDMPCRQTLMRWRRQRPDVAALIEDACDFRDWLLAEKAEHLLATANTAEARREVAVLNHRRGALRGWGGGAREGAGGVVKATLEGPFYGSEDPDPPNSSGRNLHVLSAVAELIDETHPFPVRGLQSTWSFRRTGARARGEIASDSTSRPIAPPA